MRLHVYIAATDSLRRTGQTGAAGWPARCACDGLSWAAGERSRSPSDSYVSHDHTCVGVRGGVGGVIS